MDAGRCKRCTFAGTVKNRKADFLFDSLNLVGQRWLRDKEIFCCSIKIFNLGQLENIVDLFCIYGVALLYY